MLQDGLKERVLDGTPKQGWGWTTPGGLAKKLECSQEEAEAALKELEAEGLVAQTLVMLYGMVWVRPYTEEDRERNRYWHEYMKEREQERYYERKINDTKETLKELKRLRKEAILRRELRATLKKEASAA